MLYAFGFERIGVVVSDLYFVDPDPNPGQESPERGVRLEVRFLDKAPLQGGIYSAQPIEVGRPVWRCDLLESVDSPPGSFDRTHHHPRFAAWEPGARVFVDELSADPLGWLRARLADPSTMLDEAGITLAELGDSDATDLAAAADEIVAATDLLLRRVHRGELGRPSPTQPLDNHRAGWL